MSAGPYTSEYRYTVAKDLGRRFQLLDLRRQAAALAALAAMQPELVEAVVRIAEELDRDAKPVD